MRNLEIEHVLNMNNTINDQFDVFQNELKNMNRKIKYPAIIEVDDSFYKLIDDISGKELSHERSRRIKNT